MTCRGAWVAVLAALGCGSSSKAVPDGPTSPEGAVDRGRFEEDLSTVTGPRQPGSPHWQQVQDLCATRFEALGFAVERHDYGTGTNVIGVRAGTRLPEERVVVSAHYDSTPGCAGADDNATGVAGVLEAARVLALQPHPRTLVVACWDQEEEGLIGSRAYAQRAEADGDELRISFVFEMIGYRSSEPNTQATDPNLAVLYADQVAAIEANQSRGDFILLIHDERAAAPAASFAAAGQGLGLSSIALPVPEGLKTSSAIAGLRRSDHASFWDADFPSIVFTDTANYRNPHYHCGGGPDLVADLDLDFATTIIQATVATVAGELDAP